MTIVEVFHRRTAILALAALAATAAFIPLASRGPSVRVIVQTTDNSSAEAAVRSAGGTVTRELPIAGGFAATVPSDSIESLRKLQAVRAIALDGRVHVLGAPDGSKLKSVYPRAVNADKAWATGLSGAGVTVALVDTGIANVPDLAGRVVPVSTDLLGWNTAPCVNFSGESNCNDSYGHGTFIAGIIAGSGASSAGAYPGIAPSAKLVSVKIAGGN